MLRPVQGVTEQKPSESGRPVKRAIGGQLERGEHQAAEARELGVALGRTSYAVYVRRRKLRLVRQDERVS